VTFHARRVADADARLVVADGDDGLAIGDLGALGAVELDEKVFVRLND
jgi:hypothetical protein